MRLVIKRLAAGAVLINSVAALVVTTGSSCSSQCGNVLDATTPADIECDQNNYGTAAGTVFRNCLNCELASTYYKTNPNESDQHWMLYNSRYALSECLFKNPIASSPCLTSRACGSFQGAFEYGNLSTQLSTGPYDYCNEWQEEELYSGCINCLQASDNAYLANMIVLLQVGCDQRPALGSTIFVEGNVFSTALINETAPVPTGSWTGTGNSGPISLGGKVGIAIGGLCLFLAIAGFCIVCNGRRRRRAFLRNLEMRQKDAGGGWPHVVAGATAGAGGPDLINRGHDMNDTPLSQKPLRGWDDSPMSATASEPSTSYGRYYSPYASQQTSPVNGSDAHHMYPPAHQWPPAFHDEPAMHGGGGGFPAAAYEQTMQDHSFPSSAQEKAMQGQHEAAMAAAAAAGAASAPVHIGIALGGDEPSLRSKPSGASAESQVADGESYELHEVSSSAGGSSAGGVNSALVGSSQSFRNRVARENRAPVLQHPGYGRYSAERMVPTPPPVHAVSGGGLVDDRDKRA